VTDERYHALNGKEEIPLTEEEIKQGWHFCWEFDGLVRNSNEEEFKCDCNEYQNQTKGTP
jgi:hypothetical protein